MTFFFNFNLHKVRDVSVVSLMPPDLAYEYETLVMYTLKTANVWFNLLALSFNSAENKHSAPIGRMFKEVSHS